MKLNTVLTGILISAGVTLVGFGIVSLLFDFMVSTGFMDEAGSQSGKRRRTIWLISICVNLVAIQFLRKRNTFNTQRGIAIFTVLAAFAWLFYYNKSLLFLE